MWSSFFNNKESLSVVNERIALIHSSEPYCNYVRYSIEKHMSLSDLEVLSFKLWYNLERTRCNNVLKRFRETNNELLLESMKVSYIGRDMLQQEQL